MTSSVNLGSGTLTLGTVPSTSTFEGTISGTGGLIYNNLDGNVLLLTGANTYSGDDRFERHAARREYLRFRSRNRYQHSLGRDAAGGECFTNGAIGTAAITDNGNLTFARTDSITVSNAISGFGTVEIARGTVALTGNNTYLHGRDADIPEHGQCRLDDGPRPPQHHRSHHERRAQPQRQ